MNVLAYLTDDRLRYKDGVYIKLAATGATYKITNFMQKMSEVKIEEVEGTTSINSNDIIKLNLTGSTDLRYRVLIDSSMSSYNISPDGTGKGKQLIWSVLSLDPDTGVSRIFMQLHNNCEFNHPLLVKIIEMPIREWLRLAERRREDSYLEGMNKFTGRIMTSLHFIPGSDEHLLFDHILTPSDAETHIRPLLREMQKLEKSKEYQGALVFQDQEQLEHYEWIFSLKRLMPDVIREDAWRNKFIVVGKRPSQESFKAKKFLMPKVIYDLRRLNGSLMLTNSAEDNICLATHFDEYLEKRVEQYGDYKTAWEQCFTLPMLFAISETCHFTIYHSSVKTFHHLVESVGVKFLKQLHSSINATRIETGVFHDRGGLSTPGTKMRHEHWVPMFLFTYSDFIANGEGLIKDLLKLCRENSFNTSRFCIDLVVSDKQDFILDLFDQVKIVRLNTYITGNRRDAWDIVIYGTAFTYERGEETTKGQLTWGNKGEDNIKSLFSRLERVVNNEEW